MGASPCRPERPVAWVAELLLIWGRGPAVRHSKSLRLRSGSILPSAAAYHHAFQRNSAVFRRGCLWEVGGLLARASRRPLRVHVTKSVGKPDAGNPHVRFDERGTETGLLLRSRKPRRSSTLPGQAALGVTQALPWRSRAGAINAVLSAQNPDPISE